MTKKVQAKATGRATRAAVTRIVPVPVADKAGNPAAGRAIGSLADLLTMPVGSATRRRWEDELPPDVRADLDEVRRAHLAGEIKHSRNFIYAYLKKKHGLTVTHGAFENYIKRDQR